MKEDDKKTETNGVNRWTDTPCAIPIPKEVVEKLKARVEEQQDES